MGQAASEVEVRVLYTGLLRSALGIPEETVRVPEGATVGDIFAVLEERHGEGFAHQLFTADRTLASHVIVLLDGMNVERTGGLSTRVNGKACVHVLVTMNAMAGG